MAIIHNATLVPGKLDLLEAWLPGRSWFPGGEVARIGSFRFDDPEGQVGMETFVLTAGESVLQVPLTYRGGPLAGAEEGLLGTMEHSVLGTRWVYDGCADPVYAAALARAVLAAEPQAKHLLETGGAPEQLPESVLVSSSGTADAVVPAIRTVKPVPAGRSTEIRTGAVTLMVLHVLDAGGPVPQRNALAGVWEGQDRPVLLATAAVI